MGGDTGFDVSADEFGDILEKHKVILAGTGEIDGFTPLLGSLVGDSAGTGVLNFPVAQQFANTNKLDISQQIADQAAFNKALSDSVQGNVENVANLSRKGDLSLIHI